MTIRSCVVIVLTCNHLNHDRRLPDWSSFSGETEMAASIAANTAGWAFLGPMTEGTYRKHWCPHCARRERAAGNI